MAFPCPYSLTEVVKDWPDQKYDWDKVVQENRCSTWTFIPVGCQWRNPTEALVKVVKKTLAVSLPEGKVLTYSEMVTLLARVQFSINSRPLGLGQVSSSSQQEEQILLTPNQLLLGHNSAQKPDFTYSESSYSARLTYIEELHTSWWKKWIETVLPTLMPCRKWKKRSENLQAGDVVLISYKGNFVNDYRWGRVEETFPDDNGIVRTVRVVYRKRNKREKPEDYWKKPLSSEKFAVQRLVLLQPQDEGVPTGLEDNNHQQQNQY